MESTWAALKIWQTFERPTVPCWPAFPPGGVPALSLEVHMELACLGLAGWVCLGSTGFAGLRPRGWMSLRSFAHGSLAGCKMQGLARRGSAHKGKPVRTSDDLPKSLDEMSVERQGSKPLRPKVLSLAENAVLYRFAEY
jgi:hypothetical protein